MSKKSSALERATSELESLVAAGQLVYTTAQQLIHLHAVLHAWMEDFGVEVVFDPETPPELKDYLAGAALGAAKAAFAGGLVGLLIGALAGKPLQGLAIGAGVAGLIGAGGGVVAVAGGLRIRICGWWTESGPVALAEVAS